MPVLLQKFIFRIDLKSNPNVLYLFGDNCERLGFGGQAKEMRGEPNAVGVRTKRKPSNQEGEFFYDHDYDEVVAMIEEDLQMAWWHIHLGGIVIIPYDGLGTGLSRLPEKAPKIDAYLKGRLEELYNSQLTYTL